MTAARHRPNFARIPYTSSIPERSTPERSIAGGRAVLDLAQAGEQCDDDADDHEADSNDKRDIEPLMHTELCGADHHRGHLANIPRSMVFSISLARSRTSSIAPSPHRPRAERKPSGPQALWPFLAAMIIVTAEAAAGNDTTIASQGPQPAIGFRNPGRKAVEALGQPESDTPKAQRDDTSGRAGTNRRRV